MIEKDELLKCKICGKYYPKSHYIYNKGNNIQVEYAVGSSLAQVRRVCHKCLNNMK